MMYVCMYVCMYACMCIEKIYKVWCISSDNFFSVMIQRTGGSVGHFD
jgi:hypothetical protein